MLPLSSQSIHAEIAALQATLGSDAPSDQGRLHVQKRLEDLRALWRQEPTRFDRDAIAALRALAALASPPNAGSAPARTALREIFGYTSFRPGQEEILAGVLAGRDCVGIMPTGAGKSLTYQIPARLLGGTTLVISPLIALMKDQVDAVTELGIRATYLNSTVPAEERRARVAALWRGEWELVYAAPEGLEAAAGGALSRTKLSLIAVDEAHCISQWGHDFRPAYRNLQGLKQRFGNVPILALTATATPAVTRDIVEQLAMRNPLSFRGSFFRANLNLHAYKKGDETGNVREHILRLVKSRRGDSGIVYCLSRKATESTAEFLRDAGVKARAYHAGLDPATRSKVQDAFRDDDIDVVVATVAFGMGIDKPNIRYVIHRDMPRSIEAYYQEIGRAGRDGEPSDCVLFYSWADVMAYDRFSDEVDADVAGLQRRQVREIFELADARGCRHQAIVRHLGETIGPCQASCDFCGRTDLLSELPATQGKSRTRKPMPIKEARGLRQREAPGLASESTGEDELFEALRTLRKQIADGKKVPAYVVFSDATLRALAQQRPTSFEDLQMIPGVGPKKLAEYGERFLHALRNG